MVRWGTLCFQSSAFFFCLQPEEALYFMSFRWLDQTHSDNLPVLMSFLPYNMTLHNMILGSDSPSNSWVLGFRTDGFPGEMLEILSITSSFGGKSDIIKETFFFHENVTSSWHHHHLPGLALDIYDIRIQKCIANIRVWNEHNFTDWDFEIHLHYP